MQGIHDVLAYASFIYHHSTLPFYFQPPSFRGLTSVNLEKKMQLKSGIVLSSFVAGTIAHASVYGAWINGVFQGDGRNIYVRTVFVLAFVRGERISNYTDTVTTK